MAKDGDKIYFGKLVNNCVDMVWVAGAVAEDRDHFKDADFFLYDPDSLSLN